MLEEKKSFIKEKFMYDDDFNNKIYKKERSKILRKVFFSFLLLILPLIFYFIFYGYDINIKSEIFGICIFSLMMISLISGFFMFFYFLTSFFSVSSDKKYFYNRCYAITDYSSFLVMENKYFYESTCTIENTKKSITFDDFIPILEIVNVYKMKENYERVDIICDYVELTTKETIFKNKKVSIYKCYNGFEKMKTFLQELIEKDKKDLNKTNNNDISIIQDDTLSNKYTFLYPLLFSVLFIYHMTAIFFSVAFGLCFLIYDFYRMSKYKEEFENSDLFFTLEKRVNIDKIALILYSLFIIIYLIFFSNDIFSETIVFLLMIAFLIFIIKRIEK